MSSISSASLAREAPPAGYREVLFWRFGATRRQVIAVNLVVVLAIPLWLLFFRWLGTQVGRMPESAGFEWGRFILILAGVALTVILHELIHGLAMIACGARVRFGAILNQLMLYATSPGHAFARSAFLIIALAPLVGLSVLTVLGMILLAGTPWVSLLAIWAAANAAGASGDVWAVCIVLRYPSAARVIDERDGVRILLPE